MKEIWKVIDDYDNYEISNTGKIRNKKLHEIKPDLNSSGYYNFSLYKKSKRKHFSLHRLLAIAFIPNPENKKTVNHIDGNKQNNNLYNLEWCTSSENNKHAVDNKLRIPYKGEGSPHSVLTEEDVEYIRTTKGILTNQQMADKYSVNRSTIAHCRLYKTWKHVD